MQATHDLVPLLWTSGGAGGMVTRDAFERIAGSLVGRLSEALPVDAVYLDLHGAMVTEDYEDAEGELLRRVRAAVGPGVPVAISLDYHANVTPQMVEMTDALIAYRTYPHVDRVETGQSAAQALERLLARGRPACAPSSTSTTPARRTQAAAPRSRNPRVPVAWHSNRRCM